MAEELELLSYPEQQVGITVCSTGFLVRGGRYGSDQLRAFSTPEGLIEWLSRELGAGPIVWSLTLEVWCGLLDIKPEGLLEVPDRSVDSLGYQVAIDSNARYILSQWLDRELKAKHPKPPPEPKPKKAKKAKEEKPREEVKEE